MLFAFNSNVPPELEVPLLAVKATTSSATTEPPVITTLSPVARSLIVSEPALTLKVSLLLPPCSSSSPAPPVRTSSPSLPLRVSLALLPRIISLPAPPVRVSWPVPPTNLKAFELPVALATEIVTSEPSAAVKTAFVAFVELF